MKKNINNFIEEITTNFSELFVETFFIRYFANYDKKELIDVIKLLKDMLNYKVDKKITKKLISLGYDVKK